MKRYSARWFLLAVVLGFLLGLLLLADTIYTFRYVVRPLVIDHVADQAGQLVSRLELAARTGDPADGPALSAVAEAVGREQADDVAWIRVAGQDGRIIASTGSASGEALPRAALDAILRDRAQRSVATRTTPGGELVVVTLPFRFQFPDERAGRVREQGGVGRPRFKIAEAALRFDSAEGPFRPLRRALAVSLLAAIALLAAMTAFTLQFGRFLQARQVEQQLAVARRVQQELLPKKCSDCGDLDFAVQFLPAFEVGGDFYDIFRVPNGDIAVVLGDVAGKGLPAAILMGVVHGAVRAVSAGWTGGNHPELTAHLNELLCTQTAANRYVTLFWGFLDGAGRTLRYVNAGHLPPLLMRRRPEGGAQVLKLEDGGPVLGLLPGAAYGSGEACLEEGDVLVAFSDGLSEAANAADEEFGCDRVIDAATGRLGRPPSDVLAGILESVRSFTGSRTPGDDLSLLVLRAGRPRAR